MPRHKHVLNDATSEEYAAGIRARLDDTHTHDIPYYKPLSEGVENHGTSHINVLTEEGAAVALTSTVNVGYVAALLMVLRFRVVCWKM